MAFALIGPTLTLRPPEPGDAPALLELAGDPEVTRWFSWGPYTDEGQALAWIERCERQRDEGVHLDLLIVDRERGPAGVTGLSEFSERDLRCVVGTWLGTGFQGTGVNRESKAIITRLAFEHLGMNRVGSYSNPANERSTKALLELAGDPEVTRWFSWGPYTDEGQALAWIERCERQREEGVHLDLLETLPADWVRGNGERWAARPDEAP
ncbi:MAG: GNAT family N-acetyltransferase, partial [Solirubrobacterales bacterium]